MLFCHFDEKNSKKTHSKLLKTFFCFYHRAVFFLFNFIETCTTVSVNNMFKKAEYKKPIFQWLKCKVLLDIETKGQVFCIALGPVTICIFIATIGLLYLFYNTRVAF